MTSNAKYKLQKIIIAFVWVLVSSGMTLLLVAAVSKRNSEHCVETNIVITGVQNNFFVDKNDVTRILEKTNEGKLEKKVIGDVDLASMEKALQKDKWIRKAELYFDNNDVLQVRISEREPIARIFTVSGRSFYLDSSLMRLPLSDKFSPRLPVFTSFPTDLIVLNKRDSNLLRQVRRLSEFIGNDAFWMAQVEQVDINSEGTFEIIPKVGEQIIHFGDATNAAQKFEKLLTFYKQVQQYEGWNKYSAVDLQYKNQVVAIRRGANEIKMDSLRTVQIMKRIIAEAQKHTNDSTNIQLVQPADDNNNNIINEHRAVDDAPDETVKLKDHKPVQDIESPVVTRKIPVRKETGIEKGEEYSNPVLKKEIKNIKKQEPREVEKSTKAPKAVMPAKSDY